MSNFQEKSIQSLESAKVLVKCHYYSSTVNRSYYACFQFVMHILFDKLKKDQREFYAEVQQRPNGSHSWASKLIGIELAKKSLEDYKWLQGKFPEFREKRIVADYHPIALSADDGNDSITLATTILNLLRKHFK